MNAAKAQCNVVINTFPYIENFESGDGGWFPGGTGSDWAWGTPSKAVINNAGSGTKCWIVGGLTGNSYTNSEASWLQSRCFDFTSIQYPYIEFKVFWEMEQRFDGAALQYSIDNGVSWQEAGSVSDANDCLHENWYNYSPITYLSSLSSTRDGWSGNIQPTAGSCQGGNGSNGWLTAKHTMPYLSGRPLVIFRFIFGAGSICNNYDGFAVDDFSIREAPPNDAAFTYVCNGSTVDFTNTSALCPTTFNWNFGDPASGSNNIASSANPSHTYSAPGSYTVTLTVSGPGNAPSTESKEIIILGLTPSVLSPADCLSGSGGSATVLISGVPGSYTYIWNTNPVQTGAIATGLSPGAYTVTVSAPNTCPNTALVTIPLDNGCGGVYFPSGFTPDNNGLNDGFGPVGNLSSISNYHFSVYNRWGERVFRSTNPSQRWDGKVNGKPADSNVFVWFAEFTGPDGKSLMKGRVMLIR